MGWITKENKKDSPRQNTGTDFHQKMRGSARMRIILYFAGNRKYDVSRYRKFFEKQHPGRKGI